MGHRIQKRSKRMYRLFAYGDVLDPWKICHGKDCAGKFVEHIEDEVKWLYATTNDRAR